MPYESEHAARMKSPSQFVDGSFRRKKIAPGVSIIVAKNKSTGKVETQAYRFNRKQFTAQQARAWLKKHDVKPIKFEPATGQS